MDIIPLKRGEPVPYHWHPWSILESPAAVERLRDNMKDTHGKQMYARKMSNGKYQIYKHISECG